MAVSLADTARIPEPEVWILSLKLKIMRYADSIYVKHLVYRVSRTTLDSATRYASGSYRVVNCDGQVLMAPECSRT